MNSIRTVPGDRVFASSPSEIAENYNRRPFAFRHGLAGNPLFERPRLIALAETILEASGPKTLRWQNSDAPVSQKWGTPLKNDREKVLEAIENLDRSGSWVLLYSVQRDPEYRVLLDGILAELEEVTGEPLSDQITWSDAYIFLASPRSVTPYHIDHESTFLFQVKGRRLANIWDADDRGVLTDREIENYYLGDLGAADYREENQAKAHVFAMEPGTGVHHPVRAPHWFQNEDACSVALGVHFCLRDYDRQARVYQINRCLRGLGMRPTPPGVSGWRDRAKIGTVGLFSSRRPETKNDLIRSGIRRITLPLQVARGLKAKIRGR